MCKIIFSFISSPSFIFDIIFTLYAPPSAKLFLKCGLIPSQSLPSPKQTYSNRKRTNSIVLVMLCSFNAILFSWGDSTFVVLGHFYDPDMLDIIKRSQINKQINNERHAIRREFEPVRPTLLKDPLGAGWALLPTLRWVGSWLPTYLAHFFAIK